MRIGRFLHEQFGDGFLQLAFGLTDIVRGHTRTPVSHQTIQTTRFGHRIMQFGVYEAFNGLPQRFSLASDHDHSPSAGEAQKANLEDGDGVIRMPVMALYGSSQRDQQTTFR
jgi:hypothetical protein